MQIEPDLEERRLGNGTAVDFFEAVEATWRDPSFAYSGGESNSEAQGRGLAVLQRLRARCKATHIVLSTHGNLMALVLGAFEPAVDFAFWKSLTMPDIYALSLRDVGDPTIARLWQETTV
jgi:2,3-bisphosphoglycerate-dependent phosphoglycerate mutase